MGRDWEVIQAVVGGYLLIIYSATLAMVTAFPSGIIYSGFPDHVPHGEVVVGALVCGLVGYSLSIYQIFLFSKYNWDWRKKIHNLGYGLAGH